jgi:hypothetical protein
MQINRFMRKTFYVDAVQVTDTNLHFVAQWCDGKVKTLNQEEGRNWNTPGRIGNPYVKVKVNRPLSMRQTAAFAGDWVVKVTHTTREGGTADSYRVYTNGAFNRSFEITDGDPTVSDILENLETLVKKIPSK